MSHFILSSKEEANAPRVLVCSSASIDSKLDGLNALLDLTGSPKFSTTHQMAAIAGPSHKDFYQAISTYKLTLMQPCSEKLVTQAMEMLVAGELLSPEHVEDHDLFTLLQTAFATERDWQHRAECADAVSRRWLAELDEGFAKPSAEYGPARLAIQCALAGGILVAMTKARADWTV